MAALRIGQLAAAAGVRVDTIRYYERLGLLPRAPRRASGYRTFDARDVARLAAIKALQALGLRLVEIRAMLGASVRCERDAGHLRTALSRTEAAIAPLVAIRGRLRTALARCDAGRCTLAAELAGAG